MILQKYQGVSLLHSACDCEYDDSNIEAGIEVIKLLYDGLPEAIDNNNFMSEIQAYHVQVQEFINSQLVYARQAKDHRLITTPDDNGQLQLHKALQNNVRLGSIKLLVKSNPSSIRSFDDSGVIPLHVACRYHSSVSVVRYMISLAGVTLDTIDRQGNTALRYACLGAKYETIALLLESYDAASVSKRNTQKKLPIDLLWESNQVVDREDVEYIDSVFWLLKAYPETLRNVGLELQPALSACPSQSGIGKKRKFGHE